MLLFLKIPPLDPDPGGKMNADPCRSGSTALLRTNDVLTNLDPLLHGLQIFLRCSALLRTNDVLTNLDPLLHVL